MSLLGLVTLASLRKQDPRRVVNARYISMPAGCEETTERTLGLEACSGQERGAGLPAARGSEKGQRECPEGRLLPHKLACNSLYLCAPRGHTLLIKLSVYLLDCVSKANSLILEICTQILVVPNRNKSAFPSSKLETPIGIFIKLFDRRNG